MQALKSGQKIEKQGNLDKVVQKARGPREFTRDGLRDVVTQFITCDDQVSNEYIKLLSYGLTFVALMFSR
jgi:Fe-S oxidoreductase